MTDPLPEPERSITQRWLSRFAFSFIIIAAYLIWEAFHVQERASTISPQIRQVLFIVGGAASASLGVLGMRERHRRR